MRILVTADWQAEFSNLEECRLAASQVTELVDKHALHAVVVAGDLKRAYNPVDTRVVKFWLRTIQTWKKKTRVLIALGNHDRIGMNADAKNWLSVLAVAGAEVFDKVRNVPVEDAWITMAPFSTNVNKLREAIRFHAHASQLDARRDVLIFHADVSGCRYSWLSEQRSNSGLYAADLQPERYLACLGGHVHLAQEVEKGVRYVGSPFATDWGEVNQKKSLTLVLDGGIRKIASRVPGWYDPDARGFRPPDSWEGTRVRKRVSISPGQDVARMLNRARAQMEKTYPGAFLHVVAFVERKEEANVVVHPDSPDHEKVRAYLTTVPTRVNVEQLRAYVGQKLAKATGEAPRETGGVVFRSAAGENVLCYEQIQLDYRRWSGLVLVTGKNRDWPGRVNGLGKTSAMQLIPLALFGRTFKDQRFDQWLRRGQKKGSVRVEMRVGRKEVVVERLRPNKLRLRVNGKDESAGMNQGGESNTQALIEKLTGMTWQTLACAVYIDPRVTEAFLFGTSKERSAVLARFQNLERFDRALELVREDQRKCRNALADVAVDEQVLEESLRNLRPLLETAIREARVARESVRMALQKAIRLHARAREQKAALDAQWEHVDAKHSRVEKEVREKRHAREDAELRREAVKRDIRALQKQQAGGRCQLCGQRIQGTDIGPMIREKEKALAGLERECSAAAAQFHRAEETGGKVQVRWKQVMEARVGSMLEVGQTSFRIRELREQLARVSQDTIRSLRGKIKAAERNSEVAAWERARLDAEAQLLEEAERAVGRDGIPAFLHRCAIPVLNAAAEKLSETLTEGQLQVRFAVDAGGIKPEVINTLGGARIEDQSDGEKGLVILIASLALRELAPRCNILVLDEPGTGLDERNARRLASALRTMAEMEKQTVFVVTHDTVLRQELGGGQELWIEKKNGVSRIVS